MRQQILLLAALTVAGCGGGGTNLCANVKCLGELTCSPTTGKCVGGANDAGVLPDLSGVGAPDLTMGGNDLSTLPPDDAAATDDAGNLMAACMAPMKLTFNNGVAKTTGDTTMLANNTSGSCGGVSGGDEPFVFTLMAASLVDAVVTPDQGSPDFDAVVYLRSNCSSEDVTAELGCDEVGPGSPVEVSTVLKPGTYYVWVDGYVGTSGKFSLTVTLSAPPPVPANDMCGGATTLAFDNMGHATAMGDLRSAANDTMGSCGGDAGPDAVFTFTTNVVQNMTATVTPDMTTPAYAPVIYLRKVCASANAMDEVACDIGSAGAPLTEMAANLPAGTYFLWVDGDGAASGKYALDVTLVTPPPNDTCTMPTPLTLVNNTVTVAIDTTGAADDTSGTCAGFSPDVVYSFTTNAVQEITALVTPDQNSPNYQPVVYIRSACADDTQAAELGCRDAANPGDPVKLVIPSAPAGTYFLWIDGDGGSVGKGTLVLTTAVPPPPPTNDTCAMPTALTQGAMAQGDTTFAKDDLGTALSMVCDLNGTGNFPGFDVSYSFTPAATGNVTATLTTDGSWDQALWLSPTTCVPDGSTCTMASDNIGNNVPETITWNAVKGTTYYLIVDSYDPTVYGAFTLVVQ